MTSKSPFQPKLFYDFMMTTVLLIHFKVMKVILTVLMLPQASKKFKSNPDSLKLVGIFINNLY